MLLCGVTIGAVCAGQVDGETRGALLKGDVAMLLTGLFVFSMGYAYRIRGWEDDVPNGQKSEIASLLIFSEASGCAAILLGLWSGVFI
jgi:hypothetical protein